MHVRNFDHWAGILTSIAIHVEEPLEDEDPTLKSREAEEGRRLPSDECGDDAESSDADDDDIITMCCCCWCGVRDDADDNNRFVGPPQGADDPPPIPKEGENELRDMGEKWWFKSPPTPPPMLDTF